MEDTAFIFLKRQQLSKQTDIFVRKGYFKTKKIQ